MAKIKPCIKYPRYAVVWPDDSNEESDSRISADQVAQAITGAREAGVMPAAVTQVVVLEFAPKFYRHRYVDSNDRILARALLTSSGQFEVSLSLIPELPIGALI